MRQHPDLSQDRLAACLRTHYALDVLSTHFLPIGYDLNAFVYKVVTKEEAAYFVKIRLGATQPPGLLVPRVLIEQGIPNILAPLRTRTQALWCSFDNYAVIVYPFIHGENAKIAGLSDDQWREFGATLQAIHSGGFATRLHGKVPAETFSLPSAQLVRNLLARIQHVTFASPSATRLAAFWSDNALQLEQLLLRAEALGKQLQSRSFEYVLCHADIHAANIMIRDDGRIYLVDWDGPLLAPRERDLLFVVGCVIAHRVTPREEALFFQGYGRVEVDMSALAYYRYERAIEDIGETGRGVFLDTGQSEAVKAEETALCMSLFDPGNIVESAREADPQTS